MATDKFNILVLGGDSFIAKCFVGAYSDIFCINLISRLSTEFPNETILEDLFSIPNSAFENIDVVINFAALVHHPEIKDDALYDRINHQLVLHNAHKAKQAGVKLFIQMSTIAVYDVTPVISINTPCNPKNSYGSSKLRADIKLLSIQEDKFKVAIVRPPIVYGGGKSPGNMIKLIKLVDKGIPLPFKGIDNSRDFINIHNLVQYLFVIIKKQISGIFIISDKQPVSTEYLVQIISKSLKKNVLFIRIPPFILKFLKRIKPNEYNKLYGSLNVNNNFPFEDLIQRFTVEQGIHEMVESYYNSKKKSISKFTCK